MTYEIADANTETDPRFRITVRCEHCDNRATKRIGPVFVCRAHAEAIADGRLIITTND